MVSINELTLTDVEFLQTVREINKNPEKHKHSDKGEMPANSKSVRLSSSLNGNQVSYRMGGNTNSRGFAKSDNPLIISYAPVKIDSGFGPRSVDLTDRGVKMLAEAQKQVNEISGISRTEFNEMKKKVEELEELKTKVSKMETKVQDTNLFLRYITNWQPLPPIEELSPEHGIPARELQAGIYWTLHDAADELGRVRE